MELIRIKNVTKQYKNGVTAIYDLSLSIKKGSFVFVIGGSGSGKSTLINEILVKSAMNYVYHSKYKPGKCDKVLGLENLEIKKYIN